MTELYVCLFVCVPTKTPKRQRFQVLHYSQIEQRQEVLSFDYNCEVLKKSAKTIQLAI